MFLLFYENQAVKLGNENRATELGREKLVDEDQAEFETQDDEEFAMSAYPMRWLLAPPAFAEILTMRCRRPLLKTVQRANLHVKIKRLLSVPAPSTTSTARRTAPSSS